MGTAQFAEAPCKSPRPNHFAANKHQGLSEWGWWVVATSLWTLVSQTTVKAWRWDLQRHHTDAIALLLSNIYMKAMCPALYTVHCTAKFMCQSRRLSKSLTAVSEAKQRRDCFHWSLIFSGSRSAPSSYAGSHACAKSGIATKDCKWCSCSCCHGTKGDSSRSVASNSPCIAAWLANTIGQWSTICTKHAQH